MRLCLTNHLPHEKVIPLLRDQSPHPEHPRRLFMG